MSINISIVRNAMDGFLDSDGNTCDLALVVNRGIDDSIYVKGLPDKFKNDFEFIETLRNTLLEVKDNPKFNENAGEELLSRLDLTKELSLSDTCEKLLKDSSRVSNFAKRTYFAMNGNMIRFELRNGSSAVAFVKGCNCDMSIKYQDKLMDCLPDMCLAFNVEQLNNKINEIKSMEVNPHDVIGHERIKKLKGYCEEHKALKDEYIARVQGRDGIVRVK